MKKHLLSTILIAALLNVANAAVIKKHIHTATKNSNTLFVQHQDTVKYLYDNFIAHKEKFQHKTLNELCKELGLTVRSYLPIRAGYSDHLSDNGVALYFEDPNTKAKKLHAGINIPSLTITFEHTIPTGKTMVLYGKTFGAWGPAEQEFYGNMTIKDIHKNIEK